MGIHDILERVTAQVRAKAIDMTQGPDGIWRISDAAGNCYTAVARVPEERPLAASRPDPVGGMRPPQLPSAPDVGTQTHSVDFA